MGAVVLLLRSALDPSVSRHFRGTAGVGTWTRARHAAVAAPTSSSPPVSRRRTGLMGTIQPLGRL